jgi:hypothetical protein
MSMKNSSETIGNQSHDLPVCSSVPQPQRHCVPQWTGHAVATIPTELPGLLISNSSTCMLCGVVGRVESDSICKSRFSVNGYSHEYIVCSFVNGNI